MQQVVGISEIVLWTADKERALAFYRDLLGLAEDDEWSVVGGRWSVRRVMAG